MWNVFLSPANWAYCIFSTGKSSKFIPGITSTSVCIRVYVLVCGNNEILAHRTKMKILPNYPYSSNVGLNPRKISFFFKNRSPLRALFATRLKKTTPPRMRQNSEFLKTCFICYFYFKKLRVCGEALKHQHLCFWQFRAAPVNWAPPPKNGRPQSRRSPIFAGADFCLRPRTPLACSVLLEKTSDLFQAPACEYGKLSLLHI